MNSKSNKLVALIICMLLSSYSAAAIVVYSYSATINYHSGISSDLQTLLPKGSQVSGTFTFDSNAPITSTGGNEVQFYGAISEFTVQFDSYYASLDNGIINTSNDVLATPPPHDPDAETYSDGITIWGNAVSQSVPTIVDTNIFLSNYDDGETDSGYHLKTLGIQVADSSGSMLSATSIGSLPDELIGDWTSFRLEFGLDCCTGFTTVGGNINNVTLQSVANVPVPASILLFCSALISLVGIKVKKR